MRSMPRIKLRFLLLEPATTLNSLFAMSSVLVVTQIIWHLPEIAP